MKSSSLEHNSCKLSIAQSRLDRWQTAVLALLVSNSWQMFLIVVGTLSSIIYPHVPLVGFAVVSGNTLTRKKALISAMSIWFANQIYSFTIRLYSRTIDSLTWGLVMGLATLMVTLLVTRLQPQLKLNSFADYGLWLTIAILGGYTIYQGTIVLIAYLMGGHGFTAAILGRILLKDALWAYGLSVIHCVFVWLHLRKRSL